MDMKRRVAMAMVFLMVFSIIDFSGFTHVSASTLNEGTTLTQESEPTLSGGDMEAEGVSTPEIHIQREDTVSSQNSEELLEEDSKSPEEQMTSGELSGITVEKTDSRNLIFANGNPITLKAGQSDDSKTRVYLDSDLDTPLEINGAAGDQLNGYDLNTYYIIGGSLSDNVASTSVTMLGGSVDFVYGGGYSGAVTGDTYVEISGGSVDFVYGGGYSGAVTGDTYVEISGGSMGNVFGGGYEGNVKGNTIVVINGGTVNGTVHGGGHYKDVQNTKVTINGGTITGGICGNGVNGTVSGNTAITINDGSIDGRPYSTSCKEGIWGNGWGGTVLGNTTITVNGGTITTDFNGIGNEGTGYGGTVNGNKTLQFGVDYKNIISSNTISNVDTIEYEVAFYNETTKLSDPAPKWIASGQKMTLPTPALVDHEAGKIVGSWKKADNSDYDFNSTVTEPWKLYPNWLTITNYKISYDGNGNTSGAVPTDNKIYQTLDVLTLPDNTGNLTKDGYTFGGWSISKNEPPITTHTMDSTGNAETKSLTFYAVWNLIPSHLVTVSNGTLSNGTRSKSYQEGEPVTITADSISGNSFNNWSGSDGVTFQDEKSTTTTFIMPANPVTISANYNTNYHYLIDEKTAEGFPEGKYKKGYATIVLKKTSYVYTGSEIRPVPVVYYTYTEYDDTGKQTGQPKKKKLVENVDYKVGTVLGLEKILITGMGDYRGTMTKEFTITPKSIKSATIEPIEDVIATGADLTSQIDARIIVKDGVNTVSRNDYVITYLVNKEKQTTLPLTPSENTIVTVSVNGKNNYKDAVKKTQTFTILPQSSTAKSVSGNITVVLKASAKTYTYSGKAIKPQIKVTDTVTNKPIAGKYYKVSYENNVNAGTGTITVSGKNKYYGSKSIHFIIEPKNMSKVKVKTLSKIAYRETIEDLELTITDGGRYLKKGVDYTVDFSSSKDLSLGKLKVKKVTLSVNALENSNYKGIKEVTCYIVPRNITNKLTTKIECESVPFAGKEAKDGAKSVPVIHYNGELLKETDFKIVKYMNNKKVGTGKVVIQGIGNYTGTRTVKFQIIKPERQ
ncbi:MAG: InlB B-repeat-containing protein [Lachnospiraceae bacterium]|nr:InlB B-repeat-containing protein [Lachnospiraceae bacterium]